MMLSNLGMSASVSAGGVANQVYCHPKQLEFFLDDPSSYKAITSLYNPYEFPIKFKVLSTAPKKYTVTDPEGFVNPKSSVNLIIKHSSQAFQSENVVDKLRIQIYQMGGPGVTGSGNSPNKPNLLGKRDLPLYSVVSRETHLLALMTKSKSDSASSSYDENHLLAGAANKYSSSSFAYGNNLNDMMATCNPLNKSPGFQKANLVNMQANMPKAGLPMQQQADNVNYLVILLGLVCLGILFLPLTGSTDSYLPVYLHVTHEIKLISTFILGMVTMVILKT